MAAVADAFDYDLFVIGAGSGGVRAARIAAGHGAKVAVAEDDALGGTCVNVGCVPKKLFAFGSHYAHDFQDAATFGWDLPTPDTRTKVDWARFMKNKDAEIERLNGVYRTILGRAGVEIMEGRAVVAGPNEVRVGSKVYRAKKILVATGSYPFVPKFPGSDYVLTSNEAFHLPSLPRRTLIVGGGYIAVEFACIFAGYGVQVTQCYRGPLFLRGFDNDVRQFLAEEMSRHIDLRFNADVERIVRKDSGYGVTLKDGSELEVDMVMFATGRLPKSKGIGLEEAGVELGPKGEIQVNEYSQTNIESIYAVGDVTDRMNLTPIALAEGHCFADTEYGGLKRSVVYENVPTAVFSQPTIGTCGLTQAQAEEKFGTDGIDMYKTSFRPLKHTLTNRVEKTLMKLIVRRNTGVVVGIHLVDPNAGELIQLAAVAMKAGATKTDFDNTIGVHPTSAEEVVTMRTKSES